MRQTSFECPNCGGPSPSVGRYGNALERRRKCSTCGFSFITDRASGTEVYVRDWDGKSYVVRTRPAPRRYLDGYERPRPERRFELAPHQRTVDYRPLGKLDPRHEWDPGHFKLLRDPDTGRPVVRDHGDLRPGEISVVLR